MSTIADYAYAFEVITKYMVAAMSKESMDTEQKEAVVEMIGQLADELVAAWREGVRHVNDAPPAPVAMSNPLVTGPPPAPPLILKEDYTYDEFAEMLQSHGRPVPDGMRQWFREIDGGYDKSSAEQRVEVYAKMHAFFATQQAEKEDVTRCYACGSAGEEKQSSRGPFYVCTKQGCGFQGRDGWRQSSWDRSNWEEKKSKFRSGGGARGRR